MRRRLLSLALLFALGCDSATAIEEEGPGIGSASEYRWADLGRACDATVTVQVLPDSIRATLPDISVGPMDLNDQWADLTTRVPGGWGGYYLDNGVGTVYLLDPAMLPQAITALRANGIAAKLNSVAKQGRWDFAQLYDWYRHITPHLHAVGGISSSDVQEAANRLQFGVIDEASRGRVEARLRELGVSCHLVAIAIAPYPVIH